MNHRERILAAMHHQPLDRLPTDIWATPEVWEKLRAHFGVDDNLEVYDKLDIDGIMAIGPTYIGPKRPTIDGIRYDEWGMGYRDQGYGSGSYEEQVVFPLAGAQTVTDLEAYTWPSPDWYDCDLARTGRPLCGQVGPGGLLGHLLLAQPHARVAAVASRPARSAGDDPFPDPEIIGFLYRISHPLFRSDPRIGRFHPGD